MYDRVVIILKSAVLLTILVAVIIGILFFLDIVSAENVFTLLGKSGAILGIITTVSLVVALLSIEHKEEAR